MSMSRIKWALFACSLGCAQPDSLQIELEIGKPVPRPEYMLFTLPQVGSAVVLHWVDGLTACPREGSADFLLKKVNPQAGKCLVRTYIGNTCSQDSLAIQAGFVYEVHTISGKLMYLKVLEGNADRLKVAITSRLPTAALMKVPACASRAPEGEGFDASGSAAPASPTPLYRR